MKVQCKVLHSNVFISKKIYVYVKNSLEIIRFGFLLRNLFGGITITEKSRRNAPNLSRKEFKQEPGLYNTIYRYFLYVLGGSIFSIS